MVITQAPILVTGINGFVGAGIAYGLLERGYDVRGTVRSLQKGKVLAELPHFESYSNSGKLTFVEVPDVQDGDFSKATEGIEVVMHVASPCHVSGTNNETDYLIPALKGSLNVLRAAHYATSVKNFILTSSITAMLTPSAELPFDGREYTEDDWNPQTYESATTSTFAGDGYMASKTIAERAVYGYQKEHQLENQIKIASINPPIIHGPIRHKANDVVTGLNQTVDTIARIVFGRTNDEAGKINFPPLCDIRDVALAHILAAEKDVQGRFIVFSGFYDSQTISDITWQQFPENARRFGVPRGTPGVYITSNPRLLKLNTTKSREVLGLKYDRSVKETLTDSIAQLYDLYEKQHMQEI